MTQICVTRCEHVLTIFVKISRQEFAGLKPNRMKCQNIEQNIKHKNLLLHSARTIFGTGLIRHIQEYSIDNVDELVPHTLVLLSCWQKGKSNNYRQQLPAIL